jgi:hypothetical protein
MDLSAALSVFVWCFRWMFKRGFPALEELEIPPINSRAARYRGLALTLFLCFAGLFLCGALIRVFGNALIADIFGWTGLGCFMMAAFCVVQAASINVRRPASNSTESVLCDECARPAVIHAESYSKSGETTSQHWCVHHAAQKLQLGADWKRQVQAGLREG